MTDESLQQPTGEACLQLHALRPEHQNLCKRLDELYDLHGLEARPSEMFQGAVFAIRPECARNPDRIAQAAHSLRDILYPFWSTKGTTAPYKKDALEGYGSVLLNDDFIQETGRVFNLLCDVAHHRSTPVDFERLIENFVKIMHRALTRREVERRTGLSRSTLYRKMREGTFPVPLKVSERAVRWRESDIRAYVDSRPRSDGATAP